MRPFRSFVGVRLKNHLIRQLPQIGARILQRIGVAQHHVRPLFQQRLAHRQRRRLARVARVGLESRPQQRNALARHRVEHGRDHLGHKALLLPVVHLHHLLPVLRGLVQPVMLAQVHQVENILLEARTPKPHSCFQEVRPNAPVHANRPGNLGHVCFRLLAQRRHRIDRRHPLRQECICHQFGKLARPQPRGQNPLARNPGRVNIRQRLHRFPPRLGIPPADQHAVGFFHIIHRRAFRQELRVRQHIEVQPAVVRVQNPLHRLGGAHRQRALFHHNLRVARIVHNLPGRLLPPLQVGGLARPASKGLGGRVHTDENDIRLVDILVNLGREKQVATARRFHHVQQPRLVDRQIVRHPCCDLGFIDIYHHHAVLRAVLGNHGHRRPTHVSSANAENVRHRKKISSQKRLTELGPTPRLAQSAPLTSIPHYTPTNLW